VNSLVAASLIRNNQSQGTLSDVIQYLCDVYILEIIIKLISCCLKRKSTAVRLLGLRVRIPPGSWMSVSSECCVLSGRGLCDGSIPHSEESYRWFVCVCVIESDQV
jgi:hypothetical protein